MFGKNSFRSNDLDWFSCGGVARDHLEKNGGIGLGLSEFSIKNAKKTSLLCKLVFPGFFIREQEGAALPLLLVFDKK